ncbi:tetratricopeptide repeat-containing diguanylate cyclase [Thaumasiovibrio subtropicus]|uniref:tetratricopeptide repeat-containing diguanylate cyclase n=1 Tax=Thaumasiovibrio subtropicus TaxID=1891207 RepID=UPI000B354D30|nr:GGDEF domain-containing protein [Thaumasiovibrio subtropicus]
MVIGACGLVLLIAAMLDVLYFHPISFSDETTVLDSPEVAFQNTARGQRLLEWRGLSESDPAAVLAQISAINAAQLATYTEREWAYLHWIKWHCHLALNQPSEQKETAAKLTAFIEEHGLTWFEIKFNIELAELYLRRGDYQTGLEFIDMAVRQAKTHNAELLLLNAYNIGGILYNSTNQLKLSQLYFTQGLVLGEKYPDNEFNARFYNNLGLLYVHLEQWEKALTHLQSAREIFEQQGLDKPSLMQVILLNEAFVYIKLGDGEKAKQAYLSSVKYLSDASPPFYQILDLKGAARLQNLLGEHEKGLQLATACHEHPYATSFPKQLGICLLIAARSAMALEDPERALADIDRAIAIFLLLDHKRWQIQAHLEKAEVLEKVGRSDEALPLYKTYHERQRAQLLSEVYALEFALETQKIQQERDLLNTQNDLKVVQLSKEKLRFRVLLVWAVLAVMIALVMLRRAQIMRHKNLELQDISFRDQLTNVHNRRFYQQEVEQFEVLNKHASYRVVLADIDWFKRINDQYGHEVGDQVLVQTARALQSVLNQDEMLVRWGGEEFLCLMRDDARLSARVTSLLAAVNGKPMTTAHGMMDVSVSVGVSAVYPAASLRTNATAFVEADQCLYQAKDAGRNRAVFHCD